ncbi:hypothetical protein [Streptomyces sp. WZ.A104]|nr:hypothetical protein [Streptomyces sp. WZ.A104]
MVLGPGLRGWGPGPFCVRIDQACLGWFGVRIDRVCRIYRIDWLYRID